MCRDTQNQKRCTGLLASTSCGSAEFDEHFQSSTKLEIKARRKKRNPTDVVTTHLEGCELQRKNHP